VCLESGLNVDGVANPSDDCPETVGLESLSGCPNSEPVVEGLSVPGNVTVGESVTISVSASDLDGQELSYYWGNGGRGSEAVYEFGEVGLRTVSVTVGDGLVNVSESVVVDVLRSEPLVSDSDGDGIPDGSDRCPNSAGSGFWSGCSGPLGFVGSFF